MKLIDELIDEKLGINSYGMRIYIIISLFFLADGSEMIIESLLIMKLGDLWDLSHTQKGFLGSAVFLGFFIGAIISGKLSDTYGRRPVFIAGSIVTAVFSLVSAFSPNYYFLVVMRSFFGMGVGLSIPSCSALAIEITPTKYRAWVLNLIWVFFPFGEIFAVLIASAVINKVHGWRYLLGIVSIPAAISCIMSFFVNESPRFYLVTKQFDRAFINLDRILQYSKDRILLNEEMKNRIIAEEVQESDEIQLKSNCSKYATKK